VSGASSRLPDLLCFYIIFFTKMKQFALYLDESGSQKPSPHDQATFFAMGGVIIERGGETV
jgi:hypothetical protein